MFFFSQEAISTDEISAPIPKKRRVGKKWTIRPQKAPVNADNQEDFSTVNQDDFYPDNQDLNTASTTEIDVRLYSYC